MACNQDTKTKLELILQAAELAIMVQLAQEAIAIAASCTPPLLLPWIYRRDELDHPEEASESELQVWAEKGIPICNQWGEG